MIGRRSLLSVFFLGAVTPRALKESPADAPVATSPLGYSFADEGRVARRLGRMRHAHLDSYAVDRSRAAFKSSPEWLHQQRGAEAAFRKHLDDASWSERFEYEVRKEAGLL